MFNLRPVIWVGAMLALTACSNAIGYNGGQAGGAAGGAGAVPASANPTSPAYFRESVGHRVLFPVDQATLTEAAKATLNGQADWLSRNTDYTAIIEGHADEQGTRTYNIALGERRANAAREYLISRGVAGNRLQVISYGKERPLEICSEESCYAKNRRAVTVLAGGLTG